MFRHFKIKTRLLWLGLTAITALALLGFLAISSINAILTQIHIDNKLVDINKGMYQARLGQADYIITGEVRFFKINRDKTALALESAQALKGKMVVASSVAQMSDAIASIRAYSQAVEVGFRNSHQPSSQDTQVMLRAAQQVTDLITHLSEEEEQIALAIVKQQKSNLIILSIIAVVLVLILLYLISQSIVQPLNKLEQTFTYVAQTSNLSAAAEQSGQDEISSIAASFNEMLASFRDTLIVVQKNVLKTTEQVNNMMQGADDSSKIVAQQQIQLEGLATSMNEMAVTSKDVAQNAEMMAEMSEQSQQDAADGQQQMSQTMDNIQLAAKEIARADTIVQELKDGVLQIGDIAEVIRGISEQTNLLALNAAIEAARAGAQGRGFAVVADEVRTLAARTQQSTQEIKSTIDNLQQNAMNAADAMLVSQQQMKQCVISSDKTSHELVKIVTKLQQTNQMVAEIAAAAEQQNMVSEQASENISDISSAAQGVTNSSLVLANESRQLAQAALDLQDNLASFKF